MRFLGIEFGGQKNVQNTGEQKTPSAPGLVEVPSLVKPFEDGVVPQQQRGEQLVQNVGQMYDDAKKKTESGQQ